MEGLDMEWLYENSADEDEAMDIETNATDGLAALATGFLQQEQTNELKEVSITRITSTFDLLSFDP